MTNKITDSLEHRLRSWGLLPFVARFYSIFGSSGVGGSIKGLQIFLAQRTPNAVWTFSMGLTSNCKKGKFVCDLFIAPRKTSLRFWIFERFRSGFSLSVFDHFSSLQAISTSELIHLFLLILSNRIYSSQMN